MSATMMLPMASMARFDPGSDLRVRIGLQPGQLYRDDLPGDAEPVFEPAALTGLPDDVYAALVAERRFILFLVPV